MRFAFLMTLYVLLLNAAPMSLKKIPDFSPKASVSIVVFYTSWCPPCQRTLALMMQLAKKDPKLHLSTIDVDNPKSLKLAKSFGLEESVPYILVADHDGSVIKHFQAVPNKDILESLIQRLEEGRLENGTLPTEQRVDTWKMDRKGM